MIRINAKSIGIKEPIKVNETISKVKETFEYQKDVLQESKPQGKSQIDRVINYYGSQVNQIGKMIDYIVDMLNLNNSQIKKLKKAEFPKVVKLSTQIVIKILHYDTNDKKQSKGKK